ncbi:hypothetical protein [Marinobacter bohaiensis]|uniref:hypothetical protein n=1 Tax=Marinobacter bohaiensis TaxID=2201898 RepID=UPI000DADEB00|nr:hypothetical protein [Marinobacter bohaiensis]
MSWKTRALMRLIGTIVLSTAAGGAFAGEPKDYLASKTFLLEIRYCACPASAADAPMALLPSFLSDSSLLKVDVAPPDRGFVASGTLAMGYSLSPVQGQPGAFRFEYAARYAVNGGESSGEGGLVMEEGRWLPLFGSHQTGSDGAQGSGVAVRLKTVQ